VEDPEEKREELLKFYTASLYKRFVNSVPTLPKIHYYPEVIFQTRSTLLYCGFLLTEFLNLLVLLIAYFLTDRFLANQFLHYGMDVFSYYQLPAEEQGSVQNPMCQAFPRIASCEYHR
jgi:Innexin